MLKAADIRQKYLDFFTRRDHTLVSSAPLVPPDDPSVMFTVAGMVQFKKLYSGDVPLPYSRAVSCQKCLRAGGKGSDLENVGKTLRHFTFFEMLGNFSFGDYFKEDAITWGWKFCTDPDEGLGLPAERIWATVFGKKDEQGKWIVDDEAERIWLEKTSVVNPIIRLDEKENFWGPAGETGACGPCSEIKFFTGSDEQLRHYQEMARSNDPKLMDKVVFDIVELGDLFLEIWNLVFPQFDQQPDGSRPTLKNRGIDTGLGLERTTTAVQFIASEGKINTPYETDLLRPLVDAVGRVAGLPYPSVVGGDEAADTIRKRGLDPEDVRLALNACTDHARALTFALAEGVVPSNEGRGYVMRRILRRAARFGKKIGISEPFLWQLVRPIVDLMGDVYPDLTKNVGYIEKTIRAEEERFTRTLNQGSEILEEILAGKKMGDQISGEEAYRLYDTYGFPLDLTIEAAEERGVGVDREGFQACFQEGKQRARASWKGGAGAGQWAQVLQGLDKQTQQTNFTGYENLEAEATVIALVHNRQRVERLEEGQAGVAVLDRTPFYAEAGGQVGDQGWLVDPEENTELFTVEDTQKTSEGFYLHFGAAEAALSVGQKLLARVNEDRRGATIRNHSATHLMQGALKRILGEHITQQGSWVGPEGLRFDFTHPEAVPDSQLRAVERMVNAQVCADLPVRTAVMPLEKARETGAIAPFGEKYGAEVRVIAMGDFSREFCGGTHVDATGQIGTFVITGESSVASGIRRIEARAGLPALEHINSERTIIQNLARRLSATPDALEDRVNLLQEEIRQLRRTLEELRGAAARQQISHAAENARKVADVKYLHQEIADADHNALSQAWDALRNKSPEKTVGLFYSVVDGKVNLVVGVSDDLAQGQKLKAGDLLKAAAEKVGGKGGGRPNLARGGGNDPTGIDAAIAAIPPLIENAVG